MAHTHRRAKRSIVKRILRGALLALLVAVIAGGAALVRYLDIPSWEKLDPDKILRLDQTLHVYDRAGQPAATVHSLENRTSIPLSEVPDHVVKAIIAVEDLRFYSHHGVDFRRIAGALIHDIRTGTLSQGASTITQQLIKNTHLTTEKTWRRKAQEAWLAWQLENEFSKEEILEMYLNYNYFGGGAYGIEAAAHRYFGKSASELTLAEGALLAGVLKGTGIYAPHLNLEKSITRRNLVLDEMAEAGFITARQAREAKKEPVRLATPSQGTKAADSYIDAALTEAARILGTDYDSLVTSGYRVYTYLDAALQDTTFELLQDDTLFPEPSGDMAVEAAVVIADSRTGGVIALLGGRNYVTRGFNRATDAKRQPGSAIKPVLVYAPAMDLYGYTAATLLLDEPVDYAGYRPQNFTGRYSGPVTLRQALVESLNVPAVRVLHDIGLTDAMRYARLSGITFTEADENLTIALGGLTEGVSPMQIARSYIPLSNGGYALEPTLIRRIESPEGKTVYEHEAEVARILRAQTAFILSDILRDAALEGTGSRLAHTGIPLAAKTGTVSDGAGGVRDAWIAVYNPEMVLAVWMGYDHTRSMPENATGGRYPAALAAGIISALYDGKTPPVFIRPEGVTQVALDAKALKENGELCLAGDLAPEEYQLWEYFTKGTAPVKKSPYWVAPSAPRSLIGWKDEDGNVVLQFMVVQEFAAYRIEKQGPGDEAFRAAGTLEPGQGVLRWTDTAPEPGTNRYRVVPLHPGIIQNRSPLTGEPTGIVSIEIEPPDFFPFILPWFRTEGAATTPVPAQSPTPEPTFSPPARSAAHSVA